jgi:ElaA protein
MNSIKWECKAFKELNLDELYQILNLRQVVFVVEQDCPYIDTDFRDQPAWHLSGYDTDGDLVAYTRILPKGISYENYISIGRVVTSEKIRGKGLGRELMTVSIDKAKELLGNHPIKISAQDHLRKYYGSLGFISVGDIYDEDGIPHIGMILE